MQLGRTVAELERSLSADEYRLWLAFYYLDPWGEQRADMRSAQVVRATQGGTISDFMLFPDDANERPDDLPDDEWRIMQAMDRVNQGMTDGE